MTLTTESRHFYQSRKSSVTTPHGVEGGQCEIIFTPKSDELMGVFDISKRLYVG